MSPRHAHKRLAVAAGVAVHAGAAQGLARRLCRGGEGGQDFTRHTSATAAGGVTRHPAWHAPVGQVAAVATASVPPAWRLKNEQLDVTEFLHVPMKPPRGT